MEHNYTIELGDDRLFLEATLTKEPKTYDFSDVINEWKFGPPDFNDEEHWLGYYVDTPYIKTWYFEELTRLPLHKAIVNIDDLLKVHASSELFNLALAEDLLIYKSNLTARCISGLGFSRIDVLFEHIIKKQDQRYLKIKWDGLFSNFCELWDALYTVELENSRVSKIEFFKLSKLIFEFDEEKSDQNFRTTISQIIRREKKSKYLTTLVQKYEFIAGRRKQAHEERLDKLNMRK